MKKKITPRPPRRKPEKVTYLFVTHAALVKEMNWYRMVIPNAKMKITGGGWDSMKRNWRYKLDVWIKGPKREGSNV